MQEIKASHEMHQPKILQSHSQDHAFTTRTPPLPPHRSSPTRTRKKKKRKTQFDIHSMDCAVDSKMSRRITKTGAASRAGAVRPGRRSGQTWGFSPARLRRHTEDRPSLPPPPPAGSTTGQTRTDRLTSSGTSQPRLNTFPSE